MSRRAAWLIGAIALPASLSAQQADSNSSRPGRLFRSNEPVVMSLQADFKAVFKERDTSDARNTKRFPAVLKYLDEKGDTVTLDVQLGTRGGFRLRGNNCAFVPLKVFFDKEKTQETRFRGNGSLKLTTHCQNSERYSQNLYIEYAIYEMYNLLTPISLQARLATITWLDPANPKFTVTRPGFWIEDDDDMAKRNRGKVLMQKGAGGTDMEPKQATLTEVFEYMLGNTDFSLSALHNIRILQTDTSMNYYSMAYDFDMTGLVDPPYQVVDYRLPIKRVTDRLYRGCDHPPELFAEVAALFLAKKDSIYGVLHEIKGLTPARIKEAESFLGEFFKMIGDAGARRREFRSVCQEG